MYINKTYYGVRLMAETIAGKITKLSKDLEREIGRLESELKVKQDLLKALKGMKKYKVTRRGRKPTAAKRAKRVVSRRGRPPKKKRGRTAMSNKDKVFKVAATKGKEVRFSHLVKAVKERYPAFGGKNASHAVHQILNKDTRYKKASKGLYKILPGK